MAHLTQHPGRLKALIGEPEESVLESASLVLDRRGVVVHRARSSAEVIRIATQTGVDFMMLDVDIPGMGGLNTYHLIKETVRETGRFVPCILLADDGLSPEIRRRALDEEAFSIIPKPLTVNVLEDMLNRLYRRYFPQL